MPTPIHENRPDLAEINAAKGPYGGITGADSPRLASRVSPAILHSEFAAATNYDPGIPMSRPHLAPPEFSTINLIALLKEFQRNVSISDVKAALADADRLSYALDVNKADRAQKKKEAEDKQTEIEAASKSKNLLSLILGAVGLVAAIIGLAIGVAALTAVSGGAAAPAAVVLAATVMGVIGSAFGAVMGAMSVANSIAQEVKATRKNAFGETVPLEISFAAFAALQDEAGVVMGTIKVIGVNAASGTPGAKTIEEFKKHEEEQSMVINVTLAAVGLVLAIASIATGLAALRAGAEAGTAIAETVETTRQTATQAQNLGHAVTAGASVLLAAGGIANAVLSFILAGKRNDRAQTLIDEKTLETAIQTFQQMFDASQQHFKSSMNFQETLRTSIANAMEIYFENNITIAKRTMI